MSQAFRTTQASGSCWHKTFIISDHPQSKYLSLHIYHAYVSLEVVHKQLLPHTQEQSSHDIMFVFYLVYVHYMWVNMFKRLDQPTSYEIRMVIRFWMSQMFILTMLIGRFMNFMEKFIEWRYGEKDWTGKVLIHNKKYRLVYVYGNVWLHIICITTALGTIQFSSL